MFFKALKGKLQNARVTDASIDYTGSIAIDADLMESIGILPHESVVVADVENGNRFETYAIRGEARSGVICVNGAAARLVEIGHRLIILNFAFYNADEIRSLQPRIVVLDEHNQPLEIQGSMKSE